MMGFHLDKPRPIGQRQTCHWKSRQEKKTISPRKKNIQQWDIEKGNRRRVFWPRLRITYPRDSRAIGCKFISRVIYAFGKYMEIWNQILYFGVLSRLWCARLRRPQARLAGRSALLVCLDISMFWHRTQATRGRSCVANRQTESSKKLILEEQHYQAHKFPISIEVFVGSSERRG